MVYLVKFLTIKRCAVYNDNGGETYENEYVEKYTVFNNLDDAVSYTDKIAKSFNESDFIKVFDLKKSDTFMYIFAVNEGEVIDDYTIDRPGTVGYTSECSNRYSYVIDYTNRKFKKYKFVKDDQGLYTSKEVPIE